MTLHLMKLCVGCESVPSLAAWQQEWMARQRAQGRPAVPRAFTRNRPKAVEEILDGGSLYWVIKGIMRVRQAVTGFEQSVDEDGRPMTLILLDPTLVETVSRPQRAFQGWRYLAPEDAPADLVAAGGADEVGAMPPEMVEELRRLGLL
ncbi:MAG: DUF1489 domain-containing protein [Thalassobaculales bacterium]